MLNLRFRFLLNFVIVLAASASSIAPGATTAANSVQKNDIENELSITPSYKATWALDMQAIHSDDELSNQKNQITLGLNLKFDASYGNGISINLNPIVMAQNGYFQSQDSIDPSASRIEVRNAAFNINIEKAMTLSAGALNQTILHDPLFMSDRAFPSFRAVIKSDDSQSMKYSGFIEGAIPTSSSLSNNSNDFTKSPSLVMAGVNYTLGNKQKPLFWSTQLNTYQFNDLPQSVATASVLAGNAGIPTSGPDYIFVNEFQGYELFSQLILKDFKRTTFEATFAVVTNSHAASSSDIGWRTQAALGYDINRHFQVKPGFEYFMINEDATVAAYNDIFLNTNRVGYDVSCALVYNKLLKFNFQGGERVPIIDKGTSQPKENFYLLSVETTDAKI